MKTIIEIKNQIIEILSKRGFEKADVWDGNVFYKVVEDKVNLISVYESSGLIYAKLSTFENGALETVDRAILSKIDSDQMVELQINSIIDKTK